MSRAAMSARKHHNDGAKANHALAFKTDHLVGLVIRRSTYVKIARFLSGKKGACRWS